MFNIKSIIKFIILCAANLLFLTLAPYIFLFYELSMRDLGYDQDIVIIGGFAIMTLLWMFALFMLSVWVLKSWQHWFTTLPVQTVIYLIYWLIITAIFSSSRFLMPIPLSLITAKFISGNGVLEFIVNFVFYLIEVLAIQALALWVKQIIAKRKNSTSPKTTTVKT